MNAAEFSELLKRLGACSEGVRWARGKSLAEVWNTCERADWMLWVCGQMCGEPGWPAREELVLLACEFAETSLHFFESKYPHDKRPRRAIEAARAWVTTKSKNKKELRAADAAAYAAAAAAAAYAAAYAAATAAWATPESSATKGKYTAM